MLTVSSHYLYRTLMTHTLVSQEIQFSRDDIYMFERVMINVIYPGMSSKPNYTTPCSKIPNNRTIAPIQLKAHQYPDPTKTEISKAI